MSGPTLCRNSLNSPADVTNSPSLSGRRHGLSMERLKSAVPPDLRRAVGEGTAADLANTTSRLFAFFDSLPLFHQVMQELTDPELALCRKDKVKAVELKGHGNACFSRREFGKALRFYSQKLGLFEESLRDCDRAITISPNYSKA
ncbi:Tetratricopeptide repeat (TPR)-like superfamily protein [Zea mays]|uniref:Tetratricopeptide repeat (TPR)-like superfamily protein n=1 Tax=Zea mays TaxID=4577 RepID=A0A1D6KR73_MAIZE|nr:Tetratricopeptide repeat (TPR)-like superfamily protein [Zea mays]